MNNGRNALELERWEILYGGVDVTVHAVVPGAEPGTAAIKAETVKVRKLPLGELQHMGSAMADPLREAALYTGRKAEEIETWDTDSVLQVVTEGRRLNTKSFKAWFELQKQNAELMGVDLNQVVSQAVEKATSASTKSSNS